MRNLANRSNTLGYLMTPAFFKISATSAVVAPSGRVTVTFISSRSSATEFPFASFLTKAKTSFPTLTTVLIIKNEQNATKAIYTTNFATPNEVEPRKETLTFPSFFCFLALRAAFSPRLKSSKLTARAAFCFAELPSEGCLDGVCLLAVVGLTDGVLVFAAMLACGAFDCGG